MTARLPGRRGEEWFRAPEGEGAEERRCLCAVNVYGGKGARMHQHSGPCPPRAALVGCPCHGRRRVPEGLRLSELRCPLGAEGPSSPRGALSSSPGRGAHPQGVVRDPPPQACAPTVPCQLATYHLPCLNIRVLPERMPEALGLVRELPALSSSCFPNRVGWGPRERPAWPQATCLSPLGPL